MQVAEASPCAGTDPQSIEATERSRFRDQLQALLSRPLPRLFVCPCCQAEQSLRHTQQLQAECLFTGLSLMRYRCGSCDGIFGPLPLMTCQPAELGELYAILYRFYQEGFSQPFQEKTFYLLNPSFQRTYLNYACGDWTAGVEHLRQMNWNVSGYEPFQAIDSPYIVSDRRQLGVQAYDAVFSHNYFEHVQDPVAFFMDCRRLLKPAGQMAHSSPCYDYLFEVSPLHLFFPCGRSIDRLASRTGFRICGRYEVDHDLPGHQYTCLLFELAPEVTSRGLQ